MQPSSPSTLRIPYWFMQLFSRFTDSRNIWEKKNTFGEVGEQENVSPQSQPNPGQYKLMRAARLKIQKSAQKKWTKIRTKTRDALHPCLGNLEVWMPPFAHMNLGEIRLHLQSTVAVLKKTTAIYHSTTSYQLINMLSATLHQHLKETIYVQINLMT